MLRWSQLEGRKPAVRVTENSAESRSTAREVVDVFADVTCPFAHVGLRRFVAYREARSATKPVLRVRAWPLELVNGEPLDPDLVAQHVEELREQVAPDLFRDFDRERMPASSMPALELVAAAYERGDRAGERMSLLVRDALFERGFDLGQPDVLAELAATEHNDLTTPDARRLVLADFEDGKRRGVRGSPEFFLDGRGWYCPSLEIEKAVDGLRIRPDVEEIQAFLAACFG
jgi:predicted DsbA family dithiol-disulfide isomerase